MIRIILIFLFFSEIAHAEPEADEQVHFIAAYAVTATLVQAMPRSYKYRLITASAITILAGAIKELTDAEVDNRDLIANGLGVLTYTGIHWTFNF